MRSPLLILLLIAALGGGAWLLLGDDDPGRGDRLESWRTEDEPLGGSREPGAGASSGLTADAVPVIGVWGEGPAIPARDIQLGEVMANAVRFPKEGGRLTGALLLSGIREAVDDSVPIRFTSRGSLERFQAADLPMPAPKKAYLAELLEWMHEIGFHWEERGGCLLIRPREPLNPQPRAR